MIKGNCNYKLTTIQITKIEDIYHAEVFDWENDQGKNLPEIILWCDGMYTDVYANQDWHNNLKYEI